MLPWIGVAAVGASLLTAATIKVVDYFEAKRAQDQQAIDTAKTKDPHAKFTFRACRSFCFFNCF